MNRKQERELKKALKYQGLKLETSHRIGLSLYQIERLLNQGWLICDNREILELNS